MAQWIKVYLLGLILLGALLLTGCLQYDLDLQFDSQTHGQFIQQLHWRGGAIASSAKASPWLQILAERTEAVGGKLRSLSDDGLEIVVPFNNGKDLETRFNQFFNPPAADIPFTLPSGEPIRADLSLQQGNWVVAIHNHLRLRIDLTAVPNLTEVGPPLLKAAQLLEGQVAVTTPWSLKSSVPEISSEETWSLTTGEMNQFEADFWIPSPIGIGAIAIGLLVAVGYGIKYR